MNLLLELFDSTITYRAHYQRRQEVAALIDLVVLDPENPRSLSCIVAVLRSQLAQLPGDDTAPDELLAILPAAGVGGDLATLAAVDDEGRYAAVLDLAARLGLAARLLSDEVGRHYFSHAADAEQSLAA